MLAAFDFGIDNHGVHDYHIFNMKVALITGSNKGIGFEVARQLAQQGVKVFIGSRNPERGEVAVQRLCDEELDARMVQIDVTDSKSIESAVTKIDAEFGRLDILVNNAGISIDNAPPSQLDLAILRQTYETNVFGVFSVTKAMLPLLRKAEAARIVNVSSDLGSLSLNCDPSFEHAWVKLLAYNSSKSALNAITIQFAHELRDTPIKVNAASPGYTATNLNNFRGTRTVEQGASIIVNLATLPDSGPTGGFFNEDGMIPW